MLGKKFGLKPGAKSALSLADNARDGRDWKLAVQYYREALDQDDRSAPVWVQYGHALKESGNLPAAEDAYRQSIELNPQIADTHLQLGHALKLQGRLNDAAAAYLRSYALAPTLRDASQELVTLGWTPDKIKKAARIELASLKGDKIDPAARTSSIIFDVSDLMHYFLNARLPTGIQRVQINVIASLLERQDRAFNLDVVCFTAGSDFWIKIPDRLFLQLAELAVSDGDIDDPVWQMALSELRRHLDSGEALVFEYGAILINLGTSWWLQNYFLMVRMAKAKYGVRYIPFVHDCIPILTPEHCVKELTQDFISWLTGVFFHADGYLVNSTATASDLHKVAGLLGHTISQPNIIRLDGRFSPGGETGDEPKALKTSGIVKLNGLDTEPYVLFVGTIESRKNHLLAFNAWLALIKKRGVDNVPALVCVGNRGWMVEAAMARLNSSDLLKQKVRILSKISDEDLAELYRHCLFTFYPSAYEGWGLPVTEALCYGKAVLTTAVSSLPEAGGDFADYFDHQSERDLLEKLERLIDDKAHRNEREAKIRREFKPRSWGAIADEIVANLLSPNIPPAPAKPADSSKIKEIWPLPAAAGRYYQMGRNMQSSIWRGMIGGEMYRMGTGWFGPDDWGTWLKGGPADIAFSVPDCGGHAMIVYIGFLGSPLHMTSYSARIMGDKVEISGHLKPGETRWAMLRIPAHLNKDGIVHVRLNATGLTDLREVTDGGDKRVVSLGVCGFYVCREDDLLARHNFTEALLLNSLVSISGRPQDAVVYG